MVNHAAECLMSAKANALRRHADAQQYVSIDSDLVPSMQMKVGQGRLTPPLAEEPPCAPKRAEWHSRMAELNITSLAGNKKTSKPKNNTGRPLHRNV